MNKQKKNGFQWKDHDTEEHQKICLNCPLDIQYCHGDCWEAGKTPFDMEHRRACFVGYDSRAAYELWQKGLNDIEIAEKLCVSASTIGRWRRGAGLKKVSRRKKE